MSKRSQCDEARAINMYDKSKESKDVDSSD